MKKILWILVSLACGMVHARYATVRSEKQFYDEINKYAYAVAVFVDYAEGKDDTEKDVKKEVKLLKSMMKALADTDPFKKDLKDEVGFIVVVLQKNGLDEIMAKYNVQDMPHFILFEQGKPMLDEDGNVAQIHGFVAKADVQNLLDEYCGTAFDEMLEKKADDMAKEREMQLARLQAYAAPRYPYGLYSPYNPWGSPSPYMYSGYAAFYPYGYSYNGYAYIVP